MSLKERIVADMKTAMRSRDTVRLDTIRLLRAAIQRKEVDNRIELEDSDVLQVVQKLVKQCRDAADQFQQGGRPDLADREKANMAILAAYLPAPLSDAEMDRLVDEVIQQTGASSMKDMGKVMRVVKSRAQGQADMGAVSGKIKRLLAGLPQSG